MMMVTEQMAHAALLSLTDAGVINPALTLQQQLTAIYTALEAAQSVDHSLLHARLQASVAVEALQTIARQAQEAIAKSRGTDHG